MNIKAVNVLPFVFAGGLLLGAASAAQAAPELCLGGGVNNTYSASANGQYADACHFLEANLASASEITNHTNVLYGSLDPFTYIGKNGESGDIPGFQLVVSGSDEDFKYLYQLIVPEAWAGTTVDWVLGVKQSSNSYMSYLFEDITLGIDGGFNNFWLNPGGGNGKGNGDGGSNGKIVNDFSFVAGFIRATDVPVTVPEPSTLGLLGLGLLGLGFARRKTAKK